MQSKYLALLLIPMAFMLLGATWYYWPGKPLDSSFRADEVEILKSHRILRLKKDGKDVKDYPITLGFNARGRKVCEGDGKTPEGRYFITRKSTSSNYAKVIYLSFPNAEDRRNARAEGCSPDEHVTIHGLPRNLSWLGRFHRPFLWTNGDVMLSDSEMDELQQALPSCTLVTIYP